MSKREQLKGCDRVMLACPASGVCVHSRAGKGGSWRQGDQAGGCCRDPGKKRGKAEFTMTGGGGGGI